MLVAESKKGDETCLLVCTEPTTVECGLNALREEESDCTCFKDNALAGVTSRHSVESNI